MMKAYNLALILLLSLILDQQTSGTAKDEGLIKLQAWLKGLGKNYSLKQLKNLKKLDLSGKHLKSLPPAIFNLKVLKMLDLSNNKLMTLPSEIRNLDALRVLIISNNQIKALPPEIGKLKALRVLYLSNNQLTTLPPMVKNLKALSELGFGHNQLKSLPPVIIKLKALIYLNLSNNQLRTLPPEIGNLKSLTYLNLSNNHLTTLPPEIGKLKALTTLDIRSNRLNKLPKEIIEIKNLFILAKGNLLSKSDMERIKKLYITAKRGKKIFRTMGCTGCHDTKVGMATVPFPSRPHMASLSDADFRDCILNGRKGTAMVSYKGKVSDEEIKAIRKYIITYKGK